MATVIVLHARDDGGVGVKMDWDGGKDVEKWKNAG